MIYRAAAALPYDNHERATAGLEVQLRLMAVAAGATPDWTTLVIDGPTEAVGLHGRTWFEWRATVVADGGEEVSDDVLDAAMPTARAVELVLLTDQTTPSHRAM